MSFFFRKLAGWHLAIHYRLTSSQLSGVLSKHLRIATSRSCTKCLKSTCEVVFLLYLVVEILQLGHEIAVSQRCSMKEVF